jgi:hypothetical protein
MPFIASDRSRLEVMTISDVLQHIDLARILFGEVIPLRRDARYMS